MFQCEAPILLHIEAFILNQPSKTTSFARQLDHVGSFDREVGDPLEAGGFEFSLGIRFGFQAADDSHSVLVVLRVDVLNVVHPNEILGGLVLMRRTNADMVFWKESKKAVELFLNRG